MKKRIIALSLILALVVSTFAAVQLVGAASSYLKEGSQVKFDETDSLYYGIPLGTTVDELVSHFSESTTQIRREGSTLSGESLVNGGDTIRIRSGWTYDTIGTIVTLGDVDCDGSIGTSDYATVRAFLVNGEQLTADQIYASDVNMDGSVMTNDYVLIRMGLKFSTPLGTLGTYVEPPVEESSEEESSEEESSEEESSEDVSEGITGYKPLNYDPMKIMKLTQWDMSNIYLSSGSQRSESSFSSRVDTIVSNCVNGGFNTVLIQIRPFGDSFYPSEIYPASEFITGSYSNTTFKYDPFKILLDKFHAANISVHAWINPLRLMDSSDIAKVPSGTKIYDWYQSNINDGDDHMFKSTDAGGTTRYYLNPGYPEVRDYIISGIDEILRLYHVDGVFMDDYFYPEAVYSDRSIDSGAFAAYGSGSSSSSSTRRSFRMASVNSLVKGIYSKVHSYNDSLIYGVSPNGDIDYARQEMADCATWCSNEGYVDIMYPQFYYGMLHGSCDIPTLTGKWANVMTNSKIKFVPILTLHKAGETDEWATNESGKYEWTNYSDVLECSLTYLLTQSTKKISGTGFFCYQYFHGSEVTTATQAEVNNYSYIWKGFDGLVGKSVSEIAEYYSSCGEDYSSLVSNWNSRINGVLGKKPIPTL